MTFGVRLAFRFWVSANVVGFQPMYDSFMLLRMSVLTLGFFLLEYFKTRYDFTTYRHSTVLF